MKNPSNNPIICAIDTTDIQTATKLVAEVRPFVGAIKLGLEFFTANGASGIAQVIDNSVPLFLDLKFHDIPNTVAKAIRATANINAFMMTVHCAGGKTMMSEAVKLAKDLPHKPLIVGVTILTSLDSADLQDIGMANKLSEQVKKLAGLAQESGLDGVVCSALEIEMLRKQCGENFKLIVPGIRPTGSAVGDQKRTLTPLEAMNNGADYLVIGRPITEAKNPHQMAQNILTSLDITT